jgi:sugar phosphate permease
MMGRLGGRSRTWLLAGSLLGLCAVLLALPWLVPHGRGVTVPAVGLVGFLGLGPYSLLGGYFAVQLRGEGCAGTVTGIVDSIGYVAGILAGSGFGWLLDRGGYALGFRVLAGLSLVSAGLAFLLDFKPAASPTT